MDKQLIELALTLFGKTAIKNSDNGAKGVIQNGLSGNGKNGYNGKLKVKKTYKESDFTPEEIAEATAVQNELTKLEPTSNPTTGPRSIHKSEDQLTTGLSAEIEQIAINKQLADQGLDPTYPIGSTGFNMQNYQQGYRRREAVDDEFLKPAELNEFIRNFNPDAQIFKGEEYVLQSGGTSKKINPLLGKEGQRPLGMSKETTRTASKKGNQVRRDEHIKTKESKDMDTLSSEMNAEEIKRRKANGTWDAQWDDQFITLEHDVRLTGNPLWDDIGFRGNERWNIFIQQDEYARFFKDAVENWFYPFTRNKGRDWYLKTDRANGRDLIIMEVSTGKKIGTIPFQESYTRRGASIEQSKGVTTDLLRNNAPSFTG